MSEGVRSSHISVQFYTCRMTALFLKFLKPVEIEKKSYFLTSQTEAKFFSQNFEAVQVESEPY